MRITREHARALVRLEVAREIGRRFALVVLTRSTAIDTTAEVLSGAIARRFGAAAGGTRRASAPAGNGRKAPAGPMQLSCGCSMMPGDRCRHGCVGLVSEA